MGEAARRRIVVATGDILTRRLAGPGIRAWNVAVALSAEHDVRLVSTTGSDLDDPRFPVLTADDRTLRDLERWCDVFMGQGWVLAGRPFLTRSQKPIVADVYDPMHLEQLEQGRDAGENGHWDAVRSTATVLNEQLLRADFVLCASPKQRDFWLGHLAALGRINPATYDADETLRSLVAVVPFGVPDEPPVRSGPGVRGVVPGVEPGDRLLLWGGGIYNWFDPLTLIRAVDLVRHQVPNVRLVFMGVRHPNPEIGEMRMAAAARDLARSLGLVGTHVFFNEGWIPYDERQNVLLDADVGVSTHLDHVETEFSFRTRVLDYLWAGLPTVATAGDSLAAVLEQHRAGLTVPAGDEAALAAALCRLLTDADLVAECRSGAARAILDLRWSTVLEPLLAFCRAPRRAPDVSNPRYAARLGPRTRLEPATGWRADLRRGATHLRQGGPRLLALRIRSRIARTLRW